MIELVVDTPWRNPPFDWYFKNGKQVNYTSHKMIKGWSTTTNKPKARTPFNVITEEVLND